MHLLFRSLLISFPVFCFGFFGISCASRFQQEGELLMMVLALMDFQTASGERVLEH